MGACLGCCQTDAESPASKLISEELQKEQRLKLGVWGVSYWERRIHDIVILGAPNSGKTALFNQLDQLLNPIENMNNAMQELRAIKDIRQNCIDNMYVLCDMMNDEKSMESLEKCSIDNLPIITEIISNLWNKTDVKNKYSYRYFDAEQYFIDENMSYFFDKINIIMDANYHPSIEDILKHRSTNHSFRDIEWKIDDPGHGFQISDVGTVRDALYWKQMHFFNTMAAVIFIVDLSGYCKNILEESINDMLESLSFLNRIVNERYLRRTQIVLMFNKDKIFRECLKAGISIKVCFPDYNGPEYIHFKLPMVVSFVLRGMEKETHKMIPIEIVTIIESYLRIHIEEKYANMSDEEYFGVCYAESLRYIEQMYRHCFSESNIYSHVGDVIDAEITRKIFDDIKHSIVFYPIE